MFVNDTSKKPSPANLERERNVSGIVSMYAMDKIHRFLKSTEDKLLKGFERIRVSVRLSCVSFLLQLYSFCVYFLLLATGVVLPTVAIKFRVMTIQISSHPAMGRFYTAATDLQKGTVLLSAEPDYYIPDRGSVHKVCSYCLTPPSDPVRPPDERPNLELTCASGCGLVSYCSSICADSDKLHLMECAFWSANKDIAINLASMDEYRQDYTLLLQRVLSTRDFTNVWSFCDNVDSWPDTKISEFLLPSRILAEYAAFIGLDFPALGEHPIMSRLMDLGVEPNHLLCSCMILVMKEECNSFGLYTYSYLGKRYPRQGYGLAIYCSPVFFNHSCVPNVKHTQIGKRMEFVLQESVKKGTALSISYIEHGQETNHRKTILKSLFLFECTCQKCANE
jgi:hypothetical protein